MHLADALISQLFLKYPAGQWGLRTKVKTEAGMSTSPDGRAQQ